MENGSTRKWALPSFKFLRKKPCDETQALVFNLRVVYERKNLCAYFLVNFAVSLDEILACFQGLYNFSKFMVNLFCTR